MHINLWNIYLIANGVRTRTTAVPILSFSDIAIDIKNNTIIMMNTVNSIPNNLLKFIWDI
jgi:hypothetical protein